MQSDLLKRFLNYLAVEKGLSRNTLESYERDLRKYFTFMEKKDPDGIRPQDVLDFLSRLSKEGMAVPSSARCLSAIRGFHKFLLTDNLATADPTENVDSPHGWTRLPKTLNSSEVETLLGQPDLSTTLGIRDKAMLEVIYAAGLRVSELVGLRLQDVNLERGFVVVLGKGSKERAVPLGEVASARLKEYLERARPLLLKGQSSDAVITFARPASRGTFLRTRCATLSPPISWITVRISAQCRPCSAIPTSRRRRSIPTFPASGSSGSTKNTIRGDETIADRGLRNGKWANVFMIQEVPIRIRNS
jgi:site-specific recombinase XerD